MKYIINKNPNSNLYLTEDDEMKLNYNCPDSEKNGEGKGSCGGGKNINVDDMITFRVGPRFVGDIRDNGTETMHVHSATDKFIVVKNSVGKVTSMVPIEDVIKIIKPSDDTYKQPSGPSSDKISLKSRHISTATKIERARKKGSKLI